MAENPVKTENVLNIQDNQACLLSQMFEKKIGFDVTIGIGDKVLQGHKCVLSTAIPYFAKIFSNSMDDREVDPDAFEMIIAYIYTGKLEIDQENVRTLLIAAIYLRYEKVINYCLEYFQKNINFDNILQIKLLGALTKIPSLVKLATSFLEENFEIMAEKSLTIEFTFDELICIISKDEINVRSELNVFKCIVDWIKHKPEERKPRLFELFKQIRLHLISKENLVEFVFTESLIVENKECLGYFRDALSFHILPDQKNNSNELWTRKRAFQRELIYIIGGNHAIETGPGIEKLQLRPFNSVHQKTPANWRYHCTALLGHKLYIIGGEDVCWATNRVIVYDLQTQKYSDAASMKTRRQRFGSATVNGKIYVCGGFDQYGCVLDSVESFDPLKNEWELESPMSTPRALFAAVALDGFIYAIGGVVESTWQGVKSVEKYDPMERTWTQISPMNCRRLRHGAIVHNGMIYVTGGRSDDKALNIAEVYSPHSGNWVLIPRMNHPREDPLLVNYHSKIYAIGGSEFEGGQLVYRKSIEELNFRSDGQPLYWTRLVEEISRPTVGASVQVVPTSLDNFHPSRLN